MIYNEKGISVFVPENPIGIVQVIHGMAEHHHRYDSFAEALMNAGFVVVTSDHLGHGDLIEKEDDKGFFAEKDGWLALINRQVSITLDMKEKYKGIPVIIFGHSMGSIVARSYLKAHEDVIDGVILSGVVPPNSAAKMGKNLAHLIGKVRGSHYYSKLLESMTTGGFSKAIDNARTPFDWLSKNEENVDRYIADNLCGFPFTAKGYEDMFDGLLDISEMNPTVKNLPILMVAGQDDPCTGYNKGLSLSKDTLKNAGFLNVTVKVFEGLRHEILNEKENDVVINAILQWIFANFK